MEEEKKQSICPKCDNLITDNCKKCPNCGYSLNKGSKLLSILIIFVLILLAISIYLIYLKGQNKEDTSYGKKYDGKDIQIDNSNTSDTKYVLRKYTDYPFSMDKNSKIFGNGEYLLLEGKFQEKYYYLKNYKYLDVITGSRLSSITTHNYLFYYPAPAVINYDTRESYFTNFLNKGFSADTFYDVIIFSEEYFASKKDNKDGKYGVLNKDGSIILDYEYDNIFFECDKKNIKRPEYFYIEKNDKVGIASKNGKIIVEPIYEYSSDFNITLDLNNNYYFTLLNGDNYYIFNEEGKKIFEFKKDNIIRFNYTLNKFEKINVINNVIDSIEFYDADGKLIKKIDLTEYKLVPNERLSSVNDVYYTTSFLEQNDYQEGTYLHAKNILPLNLKGAIIIGNDLNVRKLDNIYYSNDYEFGSWYHITDKFYITYSDRKYNVYTIDGKLLADNINKLYTLGLFDYVLCKNYDTKCALLNHDGNFVTDFTYDYILTKKEYSYGATNLVLKNDNNYILYMSPNYSHGKYKKLACKSKLNGTLYKYTDSNFIMKNDDGSYTFYDYDCNQLFKKKYDSIKITDSGIIVASLAESESDYSNIFKYDIIIDNKIVKYKNENYAKLNNFIGEANNMLFFDSHDILYYIYLGV